MQARLQAEWEIQPEEAFDDDFSVPEVQACWRKRLIGKTEKEYLKAKLGGLIPVDDEGIGPKCVERLSGAVQVYSLCRQITSPGRKSASPLQPKTISRMSVNLLPVE